MLGALRRAGVDAEWYAEETSRQANTVIANHHHQLELAGVFGGGTMSSSDGQRFPVRGKSLTALAMNIHFADQGLSTYTHVSDQHSTYVTKVLVPTAREAHYVLDDLLGNATDLPIREHATDTHGVTLVNFALFDLVGKALTLRIRDLGKITLCRDDTRRAVNNSYPHAGALLNARLDEDLITRCWPDLLRMAGSLKFGRGDRVADRREMVGSIPAEHPGRGNEGVGNASPHHPRSPVPVGPGQYRRKISRQLNKGESPHLLRRDLHYANQGTIGKAHLQQHPEQAWCSTVLPNAIETWSTESPLYRGGPATRPVGRDIPDQILAHVSPAHSENINFFGIITVDVEAELAKLDSHGRRPLRSIQMKTRCIGHQPAQPSPPYPLVLARLLPGP